MEPSSFQYRVFARQHPPAHAELGRARADIFTAGCVSAMAFVVGALIIMLILPAKNLDIFTVWGHQYGGVVLVSSLITAASTFAVAVHLLRQQALRHAEAAMRARQAEIDRENARTAMTEAAAVTRRLHELLAFAYDAAAAIPGELETACGYIPVARREFGDRAYTPFWAAVEHSAELLATIADRLRQITASAHDYQRLLLDRDHDFPPFPITLTILPDPSPTASALATIVRLGQTDYQFAFIQVQRKPARVTDMLADAPGLVIDAYADASMALHALLDMIDPRLVPTRAAAERVAELQQRLLRE